MKKLFFAFMVLSQLCVAQGVSKKGDDEKEKKIYHYVCNLTNDEYHNLDNCAVLQQCRGGRYRRVKDITAFTPCRRCVHTSDIKEYSSRSSYDDIKRILGVRDKKQLTDSLGTKQDVIQRPGGVTMRISGPPDSKRINTIEFFVAKPPAFNTDTLLSQQLFSKLGLKFEGCRADTIKNTTPHPVTGKVKHDFAIEYRGCAIMDDEQPGTRKYYYELAFIADDRMQPVLLEKVQLTIKTE